MTLSPSSGYLTEGRVGVRISGVCCSTQFVGGFGYDA